MINAFVGLEGLPACPGSHLGVLQVSYTGDGCSELSKVTTAAVTSGACQQESQCPGLSLAPHVAPPAWLVSIPGVLSFSGSSKMETWETFQTFPHRPPPPVDLSAISASLSPLAYYVRLHSFFS